MSFPLLSLAHALSEFIPILGHWIGGDEGERVAQTAVNIAHAITGKKDGHQILQSLKSDPKLVLEFQQAILKMGQELEIAHFKDRESARLRDIAITQAGRINLRADIMVISAALGLITCLLTITLYRT